MKRSFDPEIIDDPSLPEEILTRVYRDLTRTHRFLGNIRALRLELGEEAQVTLPEAETYFTGQIDDLKRMSADGTPWVFLCGSAVIDYLSKLADGNYLRSAGRTPAN